MRNFKGINQYGMKKLMAILTVILLFGTACSKEEDNTAERAEKEWTKFIQKHLIGEWKPESIEVKPLLGPVLLEKKYELLQPTGTQDILTLNQDYTGQFKTFLSQGTGKTINFKWYHKLEELGVILEDKREFKSILLDKAEGKLQVSVPLQNVLDDLKAYLPELEDIEASERGLLFVHFNFVK